MVIELSWNSHTTNTARGCKPSVPVAVALAPTDEIFRLSILGDVTQTMFFSDYIRVSVSHEMRVYSTCERKSSTDFTETYRLTCHNCSCGTTAVFLTRYRRKIGNIPSEDNWPFGSVPLLEDRASLSRWLSSKFLLCVGWLQGAYGLIFWYMAPFVRDLCLEKQTSQDACLWNIRPLF
jgi:hypothetical protein